MDIIKDIVVRSRYSPGLPRTANDITTLIIHGTAGPNTLKYMHSGERASDYRKNVGLFHFLIERTGPIINVIDELRWSFHSHSHILDKHTIGIELENLLPMNKSSYTKSQYESLEWLVFEYLMEKYNIKVIMSHERAYNKYVRKKKDVPCPGPNFNWDIITHGLIDRGYHFESSPGLESYWGITKR